MSRKLLLALALALMMVVSSGLWRAQGAPLEGMEDDEKAARAAEAAEAAKSTPKQADQGAAAAGGAASAAKAPRPRTRRQFVKPNNWYMEIGVVAFTVVYGLVSREFTARGVEE